MTILSRRRLGIPVDVDEVCRDVGIANPASSLSADLRSYASFSSEKAETELEKSETELKEAKAELKEAETKLEKAEVELKEAKVEL